MRRHFQNTLRPYKIRKSGNALTRLGDAIGGKYLGHVLVDEPGISKSRVAVVVCRDVVIKARIDMPEMRDAKLEYMLQRKATVHVEVLGRRGASYVDVLHVQSTLGIAFGHTRFGPLSAGDECVLAALLES